jgi:bacterioferritin-associated ferredoxin
MILCSCNVLSEHDVRTCLDPGPSCPRTPAQVYQCLGCSPNCGRCVQTLRSIISDALGGAATAAFAVQNEVGEDFLNQFYQNLVAPGPATIERV